MPKVSVYLPDELYRRAREHGLALSALAQEAVEEALSAQDNDGWIAAAADRPSRLTARVATEELTDAVRDDFGA